MSQRRSSAGPAGTSQAIEHGVVASNAISRRWSEPRRARPNDERSSISTSGRVGDNQGDQRADDGERQHSEAGSTHLRQLGAPAEVPGEMPDGVAEVVEQREGETPQQQLAEPGADERLGVGERVRPLDKLPSVWVSALAGR
jgi:hypothetical protein